MLVLFNQQSAQICSPGIHFSTCFAPHNPNSAPPPPWCTRPAPHQIHFVEQEAVRVRDLRYSLVHHVPALVHVQVAPHVQCVHHRNHAIKAHPGVGGGGAGRGQGRV